MNHSHIAKHTSFYCIGLSYKKANAEIRGRFSLDENAKEDVLKQAQSESIEGIIVLSTCNRTEIYGFAKHPFELIKLLCDHSNGTVEEFQHVAYVHKKYDAIRHLYRVGTGLESQILGDFEIISQLKKGFKLSRKYNLINCFLERLFNSVIHASKRIKTETEISSGATSVAFASVQYIMKKVENISEKSILLFGTGKIGRNTCDNLLKHTHNKDITLINRTKDTAEQIAGKFNVKVKDFADLQTEINKADILIVATGAQRPTVSKDIIFTDKELLILDLSIPKNVAEDVLELPNVNLIHLDHLSQITDETIEHRKAEIPMAETIISSEEKEFLTWLEARKFAPTIKALKHKLEEIKSEEIDFQRKRDTTFNEEQATVLSDKIIQKITKHFANHLKDNNTSTDESIEVISKVFQLENSLHE